jgi:hypothetical protein
MYVYLLAEDNKMRFFSLGNRQRSKNNQHFKLALFLMVFVGACQVYFLSPLDTKLISAPEGSTKPILL